MRRLRLALPALLLAAAAAWSEQPLQDPPPLDEKVLGKAGVAEVQAYLKDAVATLDALDALLKDLPAEPDAAAARIAEPCTAMADALLRTRAAARPKGKDQALPDAFEKWLSGQEAAWAFASDRAGRAARLIAAYDASMKSWEKDWIKKLNSRKKEYLASGKELNEAYTHLESVATILGGNEGRWKEESGKFLAAIERAGKVGKALRDEKGRLDDALVTMAPGIALFDQWSALTTELVTPQPTLPAEAIWSRHFLAWQGLLVERLEAATTAFEKLLTTAEPYRTQTLFASLGGPIAGIHFSRIKQKWQDLYDRLAKDHQAIHERAVAEEARWEEDREQILELVRETDAAKERELKLESARADAPARRREIDAQYARDTGTNVYTGLFRRMVEDKDYSSDEMKKRETPEFKAAWKKIEDAAKARKKEAEALIARDVERSEAAIGEFKEQRAQNGKEIDRIKKDNARRRKEAGLGEKPI